MFAEMLAEAQFLRGKISELAISGLEKVQSYRISISRLSKNLCWLAISESRNN
jgi:hypothetical protein